jgi:hypothetical protein
MGSDLGRFGCDLYVWDGSESDPRNSKWELIRNPRLVVGRGTGLSWWTKPIADSFIPIDSFGGVFKTLSDHLWMDFNIGCQYLPSNWALSVIIDYSTWRYVKPLTILKELHRIITIDGTIIFEHGIASFSISQCDSFQYENPSHMVLKRHTFLKWIGPDNAALRNEFLTKYKGQTVVVPAHDQKSNAVEKKIGQILKIATLDYLLDLYRLEFAQFFHVTKTRINFITSQPVEEWIELKKRQLVV